MPSKARLSKRLVTLDDKVKLDVPLADLAVHEPDYKLLIAFLKAMEFSTLTRRVAEFAGVDAGRDRGVAASGDRRATERGRSRRAAPSPSSLARPAAVRRRDDARSRGRGGATPASPLTPQALGGRAAEAARKAKIDRARYEIVQQHRSPQSLDRARLRRGVVAINIETIGDDPMQATLCGLALAVAPNEACYVPLAHRKGGNGDGDGLFGGGLAPGPDVRRRRARRAQAAARGPGVLKIGQNLKFELQLFAVRGIEMRSHEDTMLMSYVLDAGRFGHALDALAPRYFNHAAIDYNDVIGTGKAKVTFDCVDVREGRALRRRGRRHCAAAVRRCCARAWSPST